MKKIILSVLAIILLVSCGGRSNCSSHSGNMVLKTVSEICHDCDGDGYVKYSCDKCGGTGYITKNCPYCGGSGGHWYRRATQEKIPCSTCGGSGKVSGSGNTTCNICGGRGYYTCAFCKGSGMANILGEWRVCPRCDGAKIEECYSCGGRGYKQGSEYEVCRTCNGSGVSGVRPIVQEGYEYCEHCHGNPTTRVTCDNCGGCGYIQSYCHTCNGTGTISVERWVEE